MDIHLLVNVRLYRENFDNEKYISTNNIFALVKSGKFSVESGKGNYVIGKNEETVITLPADGEYTEIFSGKKYKTQNKKITLQTGENPAQMLVL